MNMKQYQEFLNDCRYKDMWFARDDRHLSNGHQLKRFRFNLEHVPYKTSYLHNLTGQYVAVRRLPKSNVFFKKYNTNFRIEIGYIQHNRNSIWYHPDMDTHIVFEFQWAKLSPVSFKPCPDLDIAEQILHSESSQVSNLYTLSYFLDIKKENGITMATPYRTLTGKKCS